MFDVVIIRSPYSIDNIILQTDDCEQVRQLSQICSYSIMLLDKGETVATYYNGRLVK